MKEANIFEAWVDQLAEGTWATPDTPEKQTQLLALLSKDLPVGADATNATEQLYDLIGDDQLFDQLEELAQRDANADGRQLVIDRMQELSRDPDVRKVIDSLNIDAAAEMNPPEATPADLEEGQMKELMWRDAERMTREAFCEKWGEEHGEFWDNIMGELDEEVKDPATQTEDPAGTQQPAYPEYQDDLAGILKAAGVDDTVIAAPDYETGTEQEETTEDLDSDGVMMTRPTNCSSESAEPKGSVLRGQYGHAGKMKPVDTDTSFLDRLKELSGMIKN